MRKYTDQKNSEYGHFPRSDCFKVIAWKYSYILTKFLRFLYILGRETDKFLFLEPNALRMQ